jgi:hypothetical protein
MICCDKLVDEIILHEILGTDDATVSGVDETRLQIDNGILWVYDDIRGKWLSSFRASLEAGEKGRAKNKYLLVVDGQAINLTGYRLPRDATITALAAQTRDIETWTLHVRKNGTLTDIASLVMSGISGNHTNSLNIDLDESDRVQFYAETTTFLGIKDPLIWIEIAWRNDILLPP